MLPAGRTAGHGQLGMGQLPAMLSAFLTDSNGPDCRCVKRSLLKRTWVPALLGLCTRTIFAVPIRLGCANTLSVSAFDESRNEDICSM